MKLTRPAIPLVLLLAAAALPSCVRAQTEYLSPDRLTAPQAETYVLSPVDGNAAGVLRTSRIGSGGSSALVASLDGGLEFGRPDMHGALDWTRSFTGNSAFGLPSAPATFCVSIGFDGAGDPTPSALSLPGDRGAVHAELGLDCRPVPGLLLRAQLQQNAFAGLEPGSIGGFNLSATSELRGGLIASVSSLTSLSGSATGMGAFGLVWQPSPAGWSFSGQAAVGPGRLLPMLGSSQPDELPGRATLTLLAPVDSDSRFSLTLSAGSGRKTGSLDAPPLLAAITRNM